MLRFVLSVAAPLILSSSVAFPGRAAAQQSATRVDKPGPWRASDASGAPEWLDFGLSHRLRFAHLSGDFRSPEGTDMDAVFQQTLATLTVRGEHIGARVELEDARSYETDDTRVTTGTSDAGEILQAHLMFGAEDVLSSGDRIDLRLGRMTIDVGSRRFLARNRYRNTINGFDGLDLRWRNEDREELRSFALMPVQRLPGDPEALASDDIELDRENTDALLAGVFGSTPRLGHGMVLELFTFGLLEGDDKFASKNRRIVTPGFRLFRKSPVGGLGFEAEAVAQLGTSRATKSADDIMDLDHRAYFTHAQVGTRFAASWQPELLLQYDLASGDADPSDDVNGRFETLFGVGRGDFGPADVYSPFARSNISSPGVRLKATPIPKELDGFITYRLFWLASSTDAWTSTGLRDPSGDSGSFLGQQIEARARYHILPKNLDLEVGGAHLIRGSFARDMGMSDAPSTFVYTSLTGTI